MLLSTRGIVVHTTKFSETSIVAKILTEQTGLESYLIKGLYRSGSRLKPALFQPFTILDLVVSHRQKSSLQSIREAGYHYPYQSVPFDIRKSSVTLFMVELIYKTIREEEANHGLFNFLVKSGIWLDTINSPGNWFHLLFAIRLTKFLGFMPQQNFSEARKFFNMKEGMFQGNRPEHQYFLDEELSLVFYRLILMEAGPEEDFRISSGSRDLLLEKILEYYQLHVPGFTGMKSHQILHSVLS